MCSDIRTFSLPKAEFSVALAYTILDHVRRKSAHDIIERVFYSLVSEGQFLITLYSTQDPGVQLHSTAVASPSSSWIRNPYSKEELLRSLASFDIVSHKEITFQDRHHDLPHWHIMHQVIAQKRNSPLSPQHREQCACERLTDAVMTKEDIRSTKYSYFRKFGEKCHRPSPI